MNQCRKVRQGAHYTEGKNKSQRYFWLLRGMTFLLENFTLSQGINPG
ncbi:MAG: hypothetical protein Q8O23_00125 [Gallionella sp.]|nr:hypothetical protein [Gallionella sp.]